MKTLRKKRADLFVAGRWDIDFHSPPEGLAVFPPAVLKRIDAVADVSKGKRDPTSSPEEVFQYIDIASVDVATGVVTNPQELTGEEAPSRARKVVRAFDVIVSTCRPTRGAIAVVPVDLHNQIASTAFSIVRAKEGINPFYLHYVLRLPSTLEQFRKWSTGSSYPAILDEDIAKTMIPVPGSTEQDRIARLVVQALRERDYTLKRANAAWQKTLNGITAALSGHPVPNLILDQEDGKPLPVTIAEIREALEELPALSVDRGDNGDQLDLG